MTDKHVHEWKVSIEGRYPDLEIYAWCVNNDPNDGKTCHLSEREVERRLNATEQLSAEDAKNASMSIRLAIGWLESGQKQRARDCADRCDAYAKARGGE